MGGGDLGSNNTFSAVSFRSTLSAKANCHCCFKDPVSPLGRCTQRMSQDGHVVTRNVFKKDSHGNRKIVSFLIIATRVRLAMTELANSVFINVQANMAAGAR